MEIGETISIEGETFHHLSVVRIRPGERLLILNGNGIGFVGEVDLIAKKEMTVKLIEKKSKKEFPQVDLFICLPKKEAFEDILKMATETGIKNIYPVKIKYSQFDYSRNERTERLIESALIQSNNYYLPKIHEQLDFDKMIKLLSTYTSVLHLSSVMKGNLKEASENLLPLALIVGPEAGFSKEEEECILALPNVSGIQFNCPIMRSPTAFAVGMGHVFSLLQHYS